MAGLEQRSTFGRRKHAGGRQAKGPHVIHHDKRIHVVPTQPIHVVSRALPRAAQLRNPLVFAAIRRATYVVDKYKQFRIVHLSIQSSYLHLIVEAANGEALTTGMHSFLISAARGINRTKQARGQVFERYLATRLQTSRQIRNCVAYVMNSWRHHGEDVCGDARRWRVDKYSSGILFDGWRELRNGARFASLPAGYDPLWTHPPSRWLLRVGWRSHGLVSFFEVPG